MKTRQSSHRNHRTITFLLSVIISATGTIYSNLEFIFIDNLIHKIQFLFHTFLNRIVLELTISMCLENENYFHKKNIPIFFSFLIQNKYRFVLRTCVPYSVVNFSNIVYIYCALRSLSLWWVLQWEMLLFVHFGTVDRWSKGKHEIYYQSFICSEAGWVKSIHARAQHTISTDEHFSMCCFVNNDDDDFVYTNVCVWFSI